MARVAVVQAALALGEVDANLARLEALIRSAHREHSAHLIIVPEACTTPNVFRKALLDSVLPLDGKAFQFLTGLAKELDCVIGGGFVAKRGKHAYGTYLLAEPGGAVHLSRQGHPHRLGAQLLRWRRRRWRDRVRALGATVGLVSGWEWARMRTAARVRAGGAWLVLGGMCWPSFPTNWPGPLRALALLEDGKWRDQARELPGQVARLVGAPVAYASHVGPIVSDTPLAPGVPWKTTMIGETQICDRDGTMLARLGPEDGEGHAAAEVELRAPQPLDPIRDRFWIPGMSFVTHAAWHALNAHGSLRYKLRHASGNFPWQNLPDTDLPDEILAAPPTRAPVATAR